MEKPFIPYPIIVEGKYDKIKLDSIFDADVFTTEGFGVFRREDKAAFFRKLAEKHPLIILTDSDGAGIVIRRFFLSCLPKERQIHLYTPAIDGKERRKSAPSKAGKLGVEGVDAVILRNLLAPYVSERNTPCGEQERKARGELTKADFYALGLSGGEGSAEKRRALAVRLGFPTDISSGALLTAINLLYTEDEFIGLLSEQP